MLGKRIRDLRMRQGISRDTLASRAGLAADELTRIEEENVVQLPGPRLLALADSLCLREASSYVALLQLNGASRRFQAYCLGLPKTGTVSLCGIFGNYRSAHEFRQWDTHQMVIKFKRGQASLDEFRAFLQDRDAAGQLEMDSAHFNRHYVTILAEEFPEAKFICLIRDCYSWVDSLVNHFTLPEREALQSKELGNGMPFDLPRGDCEAKRELIRNFERYIDGPLSHWAAETRATLERLPADRSLVIRTHEIAQNVDALADLVGVPPDSLLRQNTHLNKADYHTRILRRCDRGLLREKVDQHCGELMETWFPGHTVDDYLDGHPIPTRPRLITPVRW